MNMARSNRPIPLPYEKLKEQPEDGELLKLVDLSVSVSETETRKEKTKSSRKNGKKKNVDIEASTNLFLQETSSVVKSWDVHLKLLLLEKACLTYAVLAEHFYKLEKYGVSLRYINLALNCQKAVVNHLSSLKFQKCCLLGRAGDCYFQIINCFNEISGVKEDFGQLSDTDREILKEIQDELQIGKTNLFFC